MASGAEFLARSPPTSANAILKNRAKIIFESTQAAQKQRKNTNTQREKTKRNNSKTDRKTEKKAKNCNALFAPGYYPEKNGKRKKEHNI